MIEIPQTNQSEEDCLVTRGRISSEDECSEPIIGCNLERDDATDSSDDNAIFFKKKRLNQLENSDSEVEARKDPDNIEEPTLNKCDTNSDIDEDLTNILCRQKSRILTSAKDSNSASDLNKSKKIASKNEEQQLRMKGKKKKLRKKFKDLISSRAKNGKTEGEAIPEKYSCVENNDMFDHSSSDENSSMERLKQKIKQKIEMTVCDPDTSDDDSPPEKKKRNKTTKLISPIPKRMSTKEAMENRQKIKSESNRMLREKEVSLPYHRPKALSLKDIMSRRRPALSSDGKVLPIKMSEEQLKQYALSLEERQKEMMELCKSDDSDEENDEKCKETSIITKLDDALSCKINDQIVEKDAEVVPNKTGVLSNDNNTTSNITFDTELNCNVEGEQMSDITIKTSDLTPINEICNVVANEENLQEQDKYYTPNFAVSPEKQCAEESQLIILHYDSERIETTTNSEELQVEESKASTENKNSNEETLQTDAPVQNENCDFSDDDINMDEIDFIIENSEIIKEKLPDSFNSPALIRDSQTLSKQPRLTGAPGMVIDLDGSDPMKKLMGVELLKERFTYFSKLKTPEEQERDKEKKIKPGTLHLRLKQDLEEKIAEQRSLEWAKRLQDEKQQQMELNAIRGDDSDVEDDIEKLEAKLLEREANEIEEIGSSDAEEECGDVLEDDDYNLKEKKKERNPLIDDEAEESDAEDCEDDEHKVVDSAGTCDANEENDETSDDSSESSDSEVEESNKPKKGRILKAFVDSDDEEPTKLNGDSSKKEENITSTNKASKDECLNQDEEIQPAQIHKSFSEDLFTSQESGLTCNIEQNGAATQTFSISKCKTNIELCDESTISMSCNIDKETNINLELPDNLTVICETQNYDDNLDAAIEMCSGSFSQNLIDSQTASQSQSIGEDILAFCTGKFYDNKFVSQTEVDIPVENLNTVSDNIDKKEEIHKDGLDKVASKVNQNIKADGVLKSILDELNEPEFGAPTPKFFLGDDKDNKKDVIDIKYKRTLVIDSDDDTNEAEGIQKRKKKLKKRKLEQRALQISDDEDEDTMVSDHDSNEEYESDEENGGERIVEYDSEENEVEVKQMPKKKRKASDFLEHEAELTSEDEWVGSGDEDEAGLDRMEREAGDDDIFHQGRLQRELGQIHMRDVLDQDKRDVRLLQELLFEDGDLGDGHRQRKFRWKNEDGEEEMGAYPEMVDTQEEEIESEEQWRKQRHEREVFLRQLQQQEDESDHLTLTTSTINNTNLMPTTMSSLLMENTVTSIADSPPAVEKKTAQDIPSPKRQFPIFQKNYHGSILSRGSGALARLAALATPLAADDDAPKVGSLVSTSKRNFVFATLTPEADKPKVTKRKAENVGTPTLIKKLKIDDKQKRKNSLLDHMQA